MTDIPQAWPFQEAAKIDVARIPVGSPAILETGFGPSGRPHIGTFQEVARTIMVRNAFQDLHPGHAATLYAFCDDMDGLRKVPRGLPNPDMLRENIARPVSRIPDPYGCCTSFAAHMEGELVSFLERFGFTFELKSAADEYGRGFFNEGLARILRSYEDIRRVILPTLGPENREAWSPFIPICETCGRLYTTAVQGIDVERRTVKYRCDAAFGEGDERVTGCGREGEVSILDGHVKVGWKVDWALRWFSYGVAYEMYGKDLIESAKLSNRIVKILGGEPPAGMFYELFLDIEGHKISKKVGEGLTVDGWVKYAPVESLLYFIYQNPRKQRRLYFDVIPKSVDEYLEELRRAGVSEPGRESVIWQLRRTGFEAPPYTGRIDFSLMLNLIAAMGGGDRELLWEYVKRYDAEAVRNEAVVREMTDRAVGYFLDFIEPNKTYRPADEREKAWFNALLAKLGAYQGDAEDEYQSMVFDTAKEHEATPKDVFGAFYQVLLGQERGPRFGTFVKLVGKPRAMDLLRKAVEAA